MSGLCRESQSVFEKGSPLRRFRYFGQAGRRDHPQSRSTPGEPEQSPFSSIFAGEFRCIRRPDRKAGASVCFKPGLSLCLPLLYGSGLLRTQVQCLSASRVVPKSLSWSTSSSERSGVSRFQLSRQRQASRGYRQRLLDANVRFGWTFQASTDLLCRMSDDDVCLLGESGVTHMGFGTESASEKVLR